MSEAEHGRRQAIALARRLLLQHAHADEGPGDVVLSSPTDLASYKAHFDVLMTAFGADRLICGSNWPVITLHGTFEAQIAIGEEYLAAFGMNVRDKVMFRKALMFCRRHVPNGHER